MGCQMSRLFMGHVFRKSWCRHDRRVELRRREQERKTDKLRGGARLGASPEERSSAYGPGHAHRGSEVTWCLVGWPPESLGEDGVSEEGFPAEAGGLGVPPGCKCSPGG